jgi:hypothetical protein
VSARRRLRITAVSDGRPFTRKDGGEGRVYELTAEAEDGQVVTERLISFSPLALGELQNFEVERREHDQFGTSYIVKEPRGSLARRVADLERRVADLEGLR